MFIQHPLAKSRILAYINHMARPLGTKILSWSVLATLWFITCKTIWSLATDSSFPIANQVDPYIPKLDPTVGSQIKLPAVDLGLRTVGKVKGPILLVTPGGCYGCSLKAFNPKTIKFEDYAQVLIIYATTKQEIERSLIYMNPRARIVADPRAVWLSGLNAVFTPRFYLIDGTDNRLVDLSRYRGQVPAFVHVRKASR